MKAVFGLLSLVAARRRQGDLLGLLREVQGGDGVLAHGLLILLVQFGILVLDDLAHAELGQLLRHQFLGRTARARSWSCPARRRR